MPVCVLSPLCRMVRKKETGELLTGEPNRNLHRVLSMSVFCFPFYMENLLEAGRDWIFFTFIAPVMYFTQT